MVSMATCAGGGCWHCAGLCSHCSDCADGLGSPQETTRFVPNSVKMTASLN